MSDIVFLGYDRERSKVWSIGPDQVIGGCRNEEHVRRAMAAYGFEPFTLAAYLSHWGPILEEKP